MSKLTFAAKYAMFEAVNCYLGLSDKERHKANENTFEWLKNLISQSEDIDPIHNLSSNDFIFYLSCETIDLVEHYLMLLPKEKVIKAVNKLKEEM